jgi:hypothetical protein
MLSYAMSYIPLLFFDASALNFYIDGKQGVKQRNTIKLFEALDAGRYKAYSSDAVLDELKRTSQPKRDELVGLFDKYMQEVFQSNDEIEHLAGLYVSKHIIPAKSMTDARHIATATVKALDFVVSCNMGHIVKEKTMIGTGFVNLRAGYRHIGLSTPTEVIEYDTGR